jgi:hypothetical protein
MANKNKRTKARRQKETKEAQHKKVVEKPIYRRPWIWIALAAIVIGIVVPSAYQYNQQRQADKAREVAVWEGIQPEFEAIGVSASAIKSKTFEIVSSQDDGNYDSARATVATDLRTLIAAATYDSENGWTCAQISNEDGSHLYWSSLSSGDEYATQAAVWGADGSISMQPLYDYLTDEQRPDISTGAAVEEAPETTGAAAEEPDAADGTSGAAAETSGAAAETSGEGIS